MSVTLLIAVPVTHELSKGSGSSKETVVSEPSGVDAIEADGVKKCRELGFEVPSSYSIKEKSKADQDMSRSTAGAVLLKGGTVWTATGAVLQNTDVLLQNGLIAAIGVGLAPPSGATVVNATGKHITPGLVDAHSHVGLSSWPELTYNGDTNELTSPLFPNLNVRDAFYADDPAIRLIRSGGVTTSLVLPGSGNLMGGQGMLIKMIGDSVDAMAVPNAPRYAKMACGENPKRVYGSLSRTPDSRLGVGWLFREHFERARALQQSQSDWCAAPSRSVRFPEDLALEPIVAILTKQAILHVHCYCEHDQDMIMSVSEQFNFSISAFHHATESWKHPQKLASKKIASAIFPDNWGFKSEAYDATFSAAKILNDAGADVIVKSDHPVTFAKYLMLDAARAVHYGMDEQKALESVTLTPARALGVASRLGTIEIGKEADVVVWSHPPLNLLARPTTVIINGVILDSFNHTSESAFSQETTPPMSVSGPSACARATSGLAVRGARVVSDGLISSNVTILVDSAGVITCVGGEECVIPSEADVYEANGGSVTSGLIEVAGDTALIEISAEVDTADGSPSGSAESMQWIRAADGLRVGSKKTQVTVAGGVTIGVAPPLTSGLVRGLSALFEMAAPAGGDDQTVRASVVALHVTLGNSAKSSPESLGSISGEIQALRAILIEANSTVDEENPNSLYTAPFVRVCQGVLPLAVHAHSADVIAALLNLKAELSSIPLRLVIIGGAEAHILAARLATENVGVVLTPTRCTPGSWDQRRCSDAALSIFKNAGVPFALAATSDLTHALRWLAGESTLQGLSEAEAVAAITSAPAQLFGVASLVGSVSVGQRANLVLFNGSPLSLASTTQLVVRGAVAQCNPAFI
eukprot:TRINITY_DN4960_c0_g1_i1.p1 TRINITY_DN4960_c0_g1~~TRINITY_DN4960_c0_g1_i1.p1  ORF type:complete len:902 (-),score=201.17 TRINITY_DN4960_c0_g1_i1:41-2650(-)